MGVCAIIRSIVSAVQPAIFAPEAISFSRCRKSLSGTRRMRIRSPTCKVLGLGNSVAPVGFSRVEQQIADDVRARTSGLRVQIFLLAGLVPCLALYLAVTVPGLSETFATPLGRFVLLPLAGVLELSGIVASRRVVSSIT